MTIKPYLNMYNDRFIFAAGYLKDSYFVNYKRPQKITGYLMLAIGPVELGLEFRKKFKV